MPWKFEEVWEQVKPKVWAYALRSVDYHDAEDLVSTFSVWVWQQCVSDFFKDKEEGHVIGYLVRSFKHRTIDWVRKRGRETKLMAKLKVTNQQRVVPTPIFLRYDLSVLALEQQVDHTIVVGLLEGRDYKEIAQEAGCSRATVCRKVQGLRDAMKRTEDEERLFLEELREQLGKQEVAMKVVKKEEGKYAVKVDEEIVAHVGVKDGKVRSVIITKAGTNKDEVLDAVKEELGGKKAGKKTPAKKTPVKKTAAKKTPAKKETAKKSKPKADISKVKIGAATIKGQIKAAGGEGKCLCGCGAKVAKRFLPGHDARLKSALKQAGTKAAKALAKEFGWDKLIKW